MLHWIFNNTTYHVIFITLFYYNSSSHILYKIYSIYPYSDSPLSFLFFSFLYPHLKLFFFLFTLLILSHQLTTPKTLPSSPTASLSILFLLSSPSYTLHYSHHHNLSLPPNVGASPSPSLSSSNHSHRGTFFSTPNDAERAYACVHAVTTYYYVLLLILPGYYAQQRNFTLFHLYALHSPHLLFALSLPLNNDSILQWHIFFLFSLLLLCFWSYDPLIKHFFFSFSV